MSTQIEIEGTESPDRDDELHAIGMELYDLQQRLKQLKKDEQAKREDAAALLKLRGIDHYHVDGVELWVESGPSKVKVRKDSGGGGLVITDDEEA
jgi:hypothetical protein